MLLERPARHLVGVFRGNRQHDASLAQIECQALNSEMGFARRIALGDVYALDAVVADDSAPNRVIEVEDQHLAALAADGGYHAANVIGIQRDEFLRERK